MGTGSACHELANGWFIEILDLTDDDQAKSEASRKSLAVAFDQMILDDDKAFESNIGSRRECIVSN